MSNYCTSEGKADGFADHFEEKVRKAKSETQTNHHMEENGKRKITGIYEDHWVTPRR